MRRIKVLIVDDEYLERTLIKLGNDWTSNGFDIIGEADSGITALDIIEKIKPDIVFTDIYMPFMDGLNLTEKLREKYKDIKVVIITGHRDFEYAQKAIKYGVTEFLLKPIKSEEILKIALKLKNVIEEERKINEEYTLLKNQVKESKDILKENFLKKLLLGQLTHNEIMEKLNQYNMNYILASNLCICVRIAENNKLEIDDILKDLINKVQNYDCFLFLDNELVLILGNVLDLHKYDSVYESLIKLLIDRYKCRVTVGIGNIHKGIQGIQASYREAVEAVKARVIYDNNQVIFYEYIKLGSKEIGDIYSINWKELSFCIKNGLKEKSIEFIENYVLKLAQYSDIDANIVRMVSTNIISGLITILSDMGKKALITYIEEYDMYSKISKIDTLNDMKIVLNEFISKVIDFSNSSNSRKPNELIEKVKLFIEENYTDSNLNLTDIAAKFYVNQSYLSRIFKNETNEGISDYIGKLRINKSIEYIRETNLKVYEIAEKVGINDPHYFSICFKKYVGKTVNKYKKSINVK